MAETPGPAYRTIGDVSAIVGVPQHVLRFWETHFPQIAPLKRGGNRRYYRPADVDLLVRINRLLRSDGYTIKGVQKLLAEGGAAAVQAAPMGSAIANSSSPATSPALPPRESVMPPSASETETPGPTPHPTPRVPVAALIAIRDRLAAALAEARAA